MWTQIDQTRGRENEEGMLTELAVCGLHLRGQPLNHQLTDLGASFVRTSRSSPHYRLFALPAKVRVVYSLSGAHSTSNLGVSDLTVTAEGS